ncbi:MAG: 30S ribosome-binding factor RbfA [Anaerolineaceae bacterium]
MPSKVRLKRISDRFQQELSEMLVLNQINDPRLDQVTITEVKIDREFAYADIYVSAFEGSERSKSILAGLESASGFIRKNLAEKVDIRSMPRLRFHWDPTPERADRIERLLSEIRETPPVEKDDDSE